MLGFIYRNLRYYQEAIDHYRKSLKIDPNRADIYFTLGLIYSYVGYYEEAIAHYERAIEIRPNYADAYYQLSLVYGVLGKQQESSAKLRKAKELYRGQGNFKKVERLERIIKRLPAQEGDLSEEKKIDGMPLPL